MKGQPTKVIFRKFIKGGDVIALFPELAGDMKPDTCMSYQHVGQHGAASVRLMCDGTIPAKREEWRPLAQELRRIGYKLRIVNRFSRTDFNKRKEQINR